MQSSTVIPSTVGILPVFNPVVTGGERGYQKKMVAGLLTVAVGSFLFLPAVSAASYPVFLTALMILAAGITSLQVATNPYVVVLWEITWGKQHLQER